MATKNNPRKFNCYANAEPDEPMFVLLGRDRHAAQVVRYWVALRMMEASQTGKPLNQDKMTEATVCAANMEEYRKRNAVPERYPWGRFLDARMDMITWWVTEGWTVDQIQAGLSMDDRRQVELLVMTAKERIHRAARP